MKQCLKETLATSKPCGNTECRLHIDYTEDLNCTSVAVMKHGSMTLEQIGNRHQVSTVRAKQLVDGAMQKLKKTLLKQNTI